MDAQAKTYGQLVSDKIDWRVMRQLLGGEACETFRAELESMTSDEELDKMLETYGLI